MSNVIKVENLSKRYRLGLKEYQAETLFGNLSQIFKSPGKNLQRLRNLNRFGFEDDSVFWALRDISFDVEEGEVLGIIGKNGAGKSTLLKILSQITEPTSGKVEIHGRVASLLEVGTGFHPELSGRENIYMNGTILGMTRREIDSKMDEIIDFSGVEKFIDTPVKFYSSGMKVRLGFSVAAHLEQEILIIDEVLAVGDYEFQKKCLGKMEDVSKNQGRTVLFVSHNMGAVNSLTSKCLLLNKGVVEFLGKTQQAVSFYFRSSSSDILMVLESKFIEFLDFKLVNLKGDQLTAIGHDWDFQVYIRLKSTICIENVIVALTFFSNEGDKLSTIHVKPVSLQSGEIILTFVVSGNVMVPGDYYINLHFHDLHSDYLIIERVIDFEIFDNGSPFFQWGKVDIGKFYLSCRDVKLEYV
jgi:lipopolysaccharide transport system ATP-binding protein